jgi:hypothetical protein
MSGGEQAPMGQSGFMRPVVVHFQVEEDYKGLEAGIRDVWVDPGSCTSCYAEYRVGERFLVFGYGGTLLPLDTSALSVASEQCKSKPLPPGIDSQNPPKVYIAPECSGTRQITPETEHLVASDLRYLRKFRSRMQKRASK